jgi:Na+/proline symporter
MTFGAFAMMAIGVVSGLAASDFFQAIMPYVDLSDILAGLVIIPIFLVAFMLLMPNKTDFPRFRH